LVNAWTAGLVQVPSHGVGLEQWWNSSLAAVVKDKKEAGRAAHAHSLEYLEGEKQEGF
jgi:hypothetical protein